MLIESRPGLTVVGEVEDCADAPRAVALEKPDVVLLGLNFCPQDKCLDLLPELLSANRKSRIILLTNARDPETLARNGAGSDGIRALGRTPAELVKAIEKDPRGRCGDRSLTPASHQPVATREQKALRSNLDLLTDGAQAKIIRSLVRDSETRLPTVCLSADHGRHHLTSIFNKLDVSNRLELVFSSPAQPRHPNNTLNKSSVGRVN
jgi:DNA-binding NarL/FixJ family response regulator